MQITNNLEKKNVSPSTVFLPPSQINFLIAYLNKESSPDFSGLPAWLKQSRKYQLNPQEYADILQLINTHWKDYSHQ